MLPDSIRWQFDGNIRKVSIPPFDLIYTFYADDDLVRIEALVYQRKAW